VRATAAVIWAAIAVVAPAAAAPGGAPVVTAMVPGAPATVGDRVEVIVVLRVPAARLAGEPRFPAWGENWGEAEVREHGEVRREHDEERAAGTAAGAAGATGTSNAAGASALGGAATTVGGTASREGGAVSAVDGTASREGGAASAVDGTASAGDVAVYSQRLVLQLFRTGRVALPPIAIAVPLAGGTVQATTPAGLALRVRSVLPAKVQDRHQQPPAALRQLPLGAAFWWSLAGLAALVGLGAWGLWRRRAARGAGGAAVKAPALAPLPELLATLDSLAGSSTGIALHVGLSQALRRYLGRACGFPAPESTTTEIQRTLLGRGWPAALVRPAVEVLRACDMVKFARQEAAPERSRERLAEARRVGEQIAAKAQADEARAALGGSLEAAG
jgi:hypothetical protein